jgi:hypothetical protein
MYIYIFAKTLPRKMLLINVLRETRATTLVSLNTLTASFSAEFLQINQSSNNIQSVPLPVYLEVCNVSEEALVLQLPGLPELSGRHFCWPPADLPALDTLATPTPLHN